MHNGTVQSYGFVTIKWNDKENYILLHNKNVIIVDTGCPFHEETAIISKPKGDDIFRLNRVRCPSNYQE